MKKLMMLGMLVAMSAIIFSCSEDDGNDLKETYDGRILQSVLKSECLGDEYGQGVNIINLHLSAGEIHSDGNFGFEGEGTCLVLALFDELTEDMLPSGGTYTVADWNEMKLERTFDLGFCEYQQEYNEWLTSGTYVVSIDKDGQKSYTAFTDGSLTLTPVSDGYEIDVVLEDENGEVFKARYKGQIVFSVPQTGNSEMYKYEEQISENLSPVVTSVDIHNMGQDYITGLTKYKISIWAENSYMMQMMLYMPESIHGMISDGTYGVSMTPEAYYVQAGYFENENFIGSYMGQWDSSYNNLLKLWYQVSGELSVKNEGDQIKLDWNGSSAYGSSIAISYNGPYSFMDLSLE